MLATISPDGKYVVNAVDEGHGQQSLWMRHVATGSNAQIMTPMEVAYRGLNLLARTAIFSTSSAAIRNIPAWDFYIRFRCSAELRASWWTMSTAR